MLPSPPFPPLPHLPALTLSLPSLFSFSIHTVKFKVKARPVKCLICKIMSISNYSVRLVLRKDSAPCCSPIRSQETPPLLPGQIPGFPTWTLPLGISHPWALRVSASVRQAPGRRACEPCHCSKQASASSAHPHAPSCRGSRPPPTLTQPRTQAAFNSSEFALERKHLPSVVVELCPPERNVEGIPQVYL